MSNKNLTQNEKRRMKYERVTRDAQGNVIDKAFPVSKRTLRDQSKTSVGYTAAAIVLYVLAMLPLVAITVVLALRTYNELPAYGFWHFIALIIMGAFALIYLFVTLIVTRKGTKSSIFSQSAKIAFTFAVLTVGFGIILTYVVPDIIANATSSTLFFEDLAYNADKQIDKNAEIERQFTMYNLLNGNLNEFDSNNNILTDGQGNEIGDFSYKGLSKLARSAGESQQEMSFVYANEEINNSFYDYIDKYAEKSDLITDPTEKLYDAVYTINTDAIQAYIDDELAEDERKFELYNFIYNEYVMRDYNYCLINSVGRRALALAIVDFEYNHSKYATYLKEGMGNKRLKALFDQNYDNFNQDGYQTFDDPLLLYAQLPGRMTVPVILRLILNEGWSYSQGAVTFDEGLETVEYASSGELLYTIYDREAVDKYIAAAEAEGAETFADGETTLAGFGDQAFPYGRNADGWLVFPNGYVKRPITWLVLDMQGEGMDITSVDISSIELNISGMDLPLPDLIPTVFKALSNLPKTLDGLINEDVASLVQFAANGANLGLNLSIDDANHLNISIESMNVPYGMLGYQYATWMQSNNLLMAVLNVIHLRNWLFIFAGVGVLLIIAAGVLRECGKKTRERTEVSRDRIMRSNSVEAAQQEASKNHAKGKKPASGQKPANRKK